METFTLIHVVISLIGILSGFVIMFGLLTGRRLDGWTLLFLATTLATSVVLSIVALIRFRSARRTEL